ncbi:YggT family protein [Anoxynatronum buryatiense]|uniref:YGGT family protein n=1 Tax=Anoxynatronum buryatiense TaxID=489973 RepID=A0AA46AJW0_9CLOT|nr:YggT family protein [Anoxynatronum buryatiense]SMP63697.1 YGGT family protein [Anoxynatronum buryatiense]
MTRKNWNRTYGSQGSGRQKVAYYVGIFFYVVQILLAFRFIFKLLGANASNQFIAMLYSITSPLTSIFDGIFPEVMLENYEMLHIFESSSVIALVVTAIIAGLIRRLLIGRDPDVVPANRADTTVAQPQRKEERKL